MIRTFRKIWPAVKSGRFSIAVVAALLLTDPAVLRADDRISVFTEQDFPLNYTESGEDDDVIIGYATELVVAVLQESDLDYEIKIVPWVRSMLAIDASENVLVYSMIRNERRGDRYHWIGEIIRAETCMYGLQINADSLPKSLLEATDFRVGLVRGYAHQYDLLELGFTRIVIANGPDQLIQMFKRNRVDILLFGDNEFSLILERYDFKEQDLIAIARIENVSTELQIALSKQTDRRFVARLRSAYERVRASGQYDEIMQPLIARKTECKVDDPR